MTPPCRAALAMLTALIGAGCAASPRANGVDMAAAELQVRAIIDRFYTTALTRDWNAVGLLLADDFEIYTDEAASFHKAEYLALLTQDDLVTERMSLADLQVHVAADGSMAWSTFRGSFEMTSHGQRHDVQTAETLIFKKAHGAWTIARAHASVKELKE